MKRDTIVVTGVSSFVGCRIAALLAGRRARVAGLVSGDPDGYEPLRAARLQTARRAGVELIRTDLADRSAVGTLAADLEPDYWIQHAGWAQEYASPDYDLARGHAVNVLALTAIYESLALAGCRGVIVTGSSAEYGDAAGACLEDDACLPDMPYGLSKLTETIRARQLAYRYGVPTRVARVFIPFGPLDAPGKLIPGAADALLRNKPMELSPCGQHRDFVHVDDLAEGYDLLLDDLERRPDRPFDIVNLCGGAAVRLRDLLLAMARQADADPSLLRFGARPMRPGEPPVSYGSNAKAASLLGWRPRPLNEAVRDYMDGMKRGLEAPG